MTPNLTAFTGVDSQNLPDVMVSVQFILAIGEYRKNNKLTESKIKRRIRLDPLFLSQKEKSG
ncbi:hypothetical protein LDE01_05260 [Lactobacillus delbrueckii subsp. delbrueckii]|nr:hypothetical protein LDE01_05260 [Lactobacillus delbrueckii subsp. delbrueckii]